MPEKYSVARARELTSRDHASRRRRRQEQLQTPLRPGAATAGPAIATGSTPIYRIDVDKDRLIGRQVERQPRALLLLLFRPTLRRL